MADLDVLCVGIAVNDVMAKAIDTVPDWDRLGTFDHIEHHIGGCAVNTGADLVRLGASAAVSACVGRDGAGGRPRSLHHAQRQSVLPGHAAGERRRHDLSGSRLRRMGTMCCNFTTVASK